MALVASVLVTGSRSFDQTATTGTTSSISPTGGAVLLIIVGTNHSTLSTVTGLGLTWAAGPTVYTSFDEIGLHAYWAACSASPGSGALTITNTAGPFAYAMKYAVLQITGADPVAPIVQDVATADSFGQPPYDLTLSAASDAANRPISAWASDDSSTWMPRANWTELSETAGGPSLQTQWRSDAFDTTASATMSAQQGPIWAAIALEVKAGSGGVALPANTLTALGVG